MSDVLAAAHRYTIERGWRVVPIEFRQKRILIPGWQSLRIDADQLHQHFNGEPSNLGCLWGEPSDNCVDVDIDDPRVIAICDDLLPPTKLVYGRASRPRSHRIYRLPMVWATMKWPGIIELRSTGSQSVLPPSVHVSGEDITFEDPDAEPGETEWTELQGAIEAVIEAATGTWPKRKQPRPYQANRLSEKTIADPARVAEFTSYLLERLGNPADALLVHQVGWLVAAGHMPEDIAVSAARGPGSVSAAVANPMGYFRTSLKNGLKDAKQKPLAALLARCPDELSTARPFFSSGTNPTHITEKNPTHEISRVPSGSGTGLPAGQALCAGGLREKPVSERRETNVAPPPTRQKHKNAAATTGRKSTSRRHRVDLSVRTDWPEAIELAVSGTEPSGHGERHHAVWELIRVLKAIPEVADEEPETLLPVVRRWHTVHLDRIATKHFQETWRDFLDGWRRVLFPAGQGSVTEMFERAKVAPDPPDVPLGFEGPRRLIFLKLLRELQRAAGLNDQGEVLPFFLSGRKAAELIGVHHGTAAEWFAELREYGVVVLVEPGSYRSKGKPKAPTWLYQGELE